MGAVPVSMKSILLAYDVNLSFTKVKSIRMQAGTKKVATLVFASSITAKGWVKTLLWIFLPCFLYTVISIVYFVASYIDK